jgi:hypothetical protein
MEEGLHGMLKGEQVHALVSLHPAHGNFNHLGGTITEYIA